MNSNLLNSTSYKLHMYACMCIATYIEIYGTLEKAVIVHTLEACRYIAVI